MTAPCEYACEYGISFFHFSGFFMHYTVLRLAKGGLGISNETGKTYFIEGGLPGESGEAEIVEEKARFGRAVALTRACDAPEREPNDPCPCSASCDGCGFRHVRSSCALAMKSAAVYADIVRSAHLSDVPYRCYGLDGALDGRRCRVRLHADGGRTGFFCRGTHRIVSAGACCVIHPALREAVSLLEKTLAEAPRGRFEIQLDLDDENRPYAHFKLPEMRREDRRSSAKKTAQRPFSLSSLARFAEEWTKTGAFAGVRLGERDYGASMIRSVTAADGLEPCVMWRRCGDFAQATPVANAVIHRLLADEIARNRPQFLADLYCGSGNLTFRAAMQVPRVEGVEFFCDRRAFERGLADNAPRLAAPGGVSLTLHDLTRGLPKAMLEADMIVCDPAREGLSEAACRDIGRSRARHLFYVSCEASCLARDIVALSGAFRLRALGFVDMFPQTPHVETIGWFDRI